MNPFKLPLSAIDDGVLPEREGAVPREYQGAELNANLRKILKGKPSAVYLHGPPGCGKTRQAWAMVRHDRLNRMAALINEGEDPPMLIRSHGLSAWVREETAAMVAADRVKIITESGDIRRHRYDRDWLDTAAKYPDWLVVDDIGFASPNEWVIEAIYHLSNERRAWKRPTVWTSNLTAAELVDKFSQAIASRLAGGEVVELSGEDRRLS